MVINGVFISANLTLLFLNQQETIEIIDLSVYGRCRQAGIITGYEHWHSVCMLINISILLIMKDSTNSVAERENMIVDAVGSMRLHDAFVGLRRHAASLGDWKITERIDKLEQSYSMMLDYAVNGNPDPGRRELYDSITADILKLTDIISHRLKMESSPELFYSTLRYERLQVDDSLDSLLNEYNKLVQQTSLYNILTSVDYSQKLPNLENSERLSRRIFNRVWTSFPMSADDASAMARVFDADSPYPKHFQQLMVAALALSLVQFFDQRKIDLLLDIYLNRHDQQTLAVQALCSALIGMYLHRGRYNPSQLKRKIDSLREQTDWQSDVRMIAMQLIRTRDTERIHRKLTDEIMPQMLKLRPDIARRLSDKASLTEFPSIEDNPEWEDILEKSGLTDSLKELMQIQEEGGDVMLATFSNLKSFPFFNEVANWFVPFRADTPLCGALIDAEMKKMATLLESMDMFCDGDKYSFMLMLQSMPTQQRNMLSVQLDQQQMAAMELHSASLKTDASARQQIANRYVQQLYRFFKLFRRRGEFNDPFSRPISLAALDLLAVDLQNEETLNLVGEFYFKRGYYDDALQIFGQLDEKKKLDNASLQKMGVCQQKLGRTADALTTYQKAELMRPDSVWTMRRIAACYRALGETAKALAYYKRIETQRPQDIELALNIGHCLLETENYKDAIKYYFKVEYLAPESHKALRPIAWCSFVMGQFEQSRKYFERVLADSPTHTDYLNIGHLYMALKDMRMALKYYGLAMASDSVKPDQFIADLQSDYIWLERAGVDMSVMPLMVDALLYSK